MDIEQLSITRRYEVFSCPRNEAVKSAEKLARFAHNSSFWPEQFKWSKEARKLRRENIIAYIVACGVILDELACGIDTQPQHFPIPPHIKSEFPCIFGELQVY